MPRFASPALLGLCLFNLRSLAASVACENTCDYYLTDLANTHTLEEVGNVYVPGTALNQVLLNYMCGDGNVLGCYEPPCNGYGLQQSEISLLIAWAIVCHTLAVTGSPDAAITCWESTIQPASCVDFDVSSAATSSAIPAAVSSNPSAVVTTSSLVQSTPNSATSSIVKSTTPVTTSVFIQSTSTSTATSPNVGTTTSYAGTSSVPGSTSPATSSTSQTTFESATSSSTVVTASSTSQASSGNPGWMHERPSKLCIFAVAVTAFLFGA